MPLRYLDEATVKEYVRSETVTDLSIYTAACYAAEEFIDDECGRHFEVATAPVTRVYRPLRHCSTTLWLDDFRTITSIVENGVTLTANTDYVLEPLNQLNAANKTVPYDRAERYRAYWYWDGPKATISVTGIPDWAAIPYMVIEAAKVAAKAYVEYRDIRFGLAAAIEGAGGVTEREAKAVRDCIAAYSSWRVA